MIENILYDNKKINNLSILPWVIFTKPEIAHVGLSEKEAKEIFGDKIAVFKVDENMDRFVTDRSTIGFMKVIFNEENLVIGADAIGSLTGEWIQQLTIAIKNKISAGSFVNTIFAYITYSEIVKKVFTLYLLSKQ